MRFQKTITGNLSVFTWLNRRFLAVAVPLVAALGLGCSRSGESLSSVASIAPPLTQTYDPATHSYKLNYTYALPNDPSQIDFIELREVDLTVYSTAQVSSCQVGVPVRSWNSPFAATDKISGMYLAGSQSTFRYVLCLRMKDGSVKAAIDNNVGAAAAATQALALKEASADLSANSTPSYTAVKVTSGQYFTCALFSNGRIKCWGNNQYGQLGLGDTNHRGDAAGEMGTHLPYIDLGSTSGSGGTSPLLAVDVQAGTTHVCAIMADNSVKCWGGNDRGQLGLADTAQRGHTAATMGNNLPFVNLGTGLTAKALGLGAKFSCALLSNNAVKCWGDNSDGVLGRGNVLAVGTSPNQMGDNLAAVNVGTGRTVKYLSAGLGHVCVVLDTNAVKCWGVNDFGQLGLGHMNSMGDQAGEMGDNLPTVDLGTFLGLFDNYATSISSGASHTCVTTAIYQVKCWGDNFAGQLGQGTTADALGDQPGELGNALSTINFGAYFFTLSQPVVKLQSGFYATCVQLWTSEIKCFGDNQYGQLGVGRAIPTLGTLASQMGENLLSVDIGTGSVVKSMSSQYGTTCAISQDNLIKCWGINTNGALGYGDTLSRGTSAAQMGSNLPYVDL